MRTSTPVQAPSTQDVWAGLYSEVHTWLGISAARGERIRTADFWLILCITRNKEDVQPLDQRVPLDQAEPVVVARLPGLAARHDGQGRVVPAWLAIKSVRGNGTMSKEPCGAVGGAGVDGRPAGLLLAPRRNCFSELRISH